MKELKTYSLIFWQVVAILNNSFIFAIFHSSSLKNDDLRATSHRLNDSTYARVHGDNISPQCCLKIGFEKGFNRERYRDRDREREREAEREAERERRERERERRERERE